MADEPEDAAGNAGWSESTDGGASPLPTPIVGGQPMGADEPMGTVPPPREHFVQNAPPMQSPMPPQEPMAFQQPPPPPYYPQMGYGGPPAQPAFVTMSKSLTSYIWLIALIAGILILVGEIMGASSNFDIRNSAGTVASIGAFILAVPMLIVGIYNEDARDHVRFGLILASALLLLAMALF